MEEMLAQKYQIKTQVLGPDEDHAKQIKVFNRILSWDGNRGFIYEADPRHAEIIIEQVQLKEAKPVTTPGTKDEGAIAEDREDKLDAETASKYRAMVARCNYISPDRPDTAHSVKEFARSMSDPNRGNWSQMKRLGRYVKGRPRVQQISRWQGMLDKIRIYSDADRVGCKATRKSTIGGCMVIGEHNAKGWSKT